MNRIRTILLSLVLLTLAGVNSEASAQLSELLGFQTTKVDFSYLDKYPPGFTAMKNKELQGALDADPSLTKKQKKMMLMLAPYFRKQCREIEVSENIYLYSQPAGAQVYLDGELIGTTPGIYKLKRRIITLIGQKKKDDGQMIEKLIKSNTVVLQFVKNGYLVAEEEIAPNITLDNNRQYYMVEYPSEVSCNLQEDPNLYADDPSMRAGEAKKAVNRDNPGSTALERTIVRWYFESEPQGVRIFWRVISSCPDQVKNTNELWLGSTPFEETRSFNIPGLTYENSRDVQIEIKVRRGGYYDQTKRFNVRQAIDQQEISSFFDMIKIEE